MSIRLANGKLECRFTRPRSMNVYTEFWDDETYDLNKEYYMLLAWGPVYESKFHINFEAKFLEF